MRACAHVCTTHARGLPACLKTPLYFVQSVPILPRDLSRTHQTPIACVVRRVLPRLLCPQMGAEAQRPIPPPSSPMTWAPGQTPSSHARRLLQSRASRRCPMGRLGCHPSWQGWGRCGAHVCFCVCAQLCGHGVWTCCWGAIMALL